jgi:5'(3')-deoxyribonucleotidase
VVEQKVNEIKDEFPHLDKKDLQLKMKKDLGLHIIYDNPQVDKIESISDPKDWSAGSTAVHLACQNGAEEVYMFGFDLSTYDDHINNIYKGSKNYLPETAKGFNAVNWRSQLFMTFNEFNKVKFKWVGNDFRYINNSKIMDCKNVELLTYDNIGDIR